MADVRSLLRQQRAARRIDHPHAAYSDAGKLLCTVCHELIKAESLWEGHAKSFGHLQRLQNMKSTNAPAREETSASHKRKHDSDDEMLDDFESESLRKKRSKPDVNNTAALDPTNDSSKDTDTDADKNRGRGRTREGSDAAKQAALAPPLERRTSSTPAHGVEIRIPSRPATPNPMRDASGSSSAGHGSTASTPKVTPVGRSPLIPQEAIEAAATPLPPPAAKPSASLDESEWAAFEAEVINAPAAPANGQPSDAVISAAPMTANEVAAQSEEEERIKRKALADIQMEDEKEEATRALETEFEEMEELEARVRKLKEKREALRKQNAGTAGAAATVDEKVAAENDRHGETQLAEKSASDQPEAEGDDDDDGDEDDEDDWVGFRFRSQ